MTPPKKNIFILSLLLVLLMTLPQGVDGQRRKRPDEQKDSTSMKDSLQTAQDIVPADTLRKKKKEPLEAPVIYEAKDSIVFSDDGYAHLYGTSKVNYQKVELQAEIITINTDSSTVHACGVADSTGAIKGKPVFKDGDSPYESNTMSYNFKSHKGYITNVTTQEGEGYVTSGQAKKGPNNEMYITHARYTTCDHHDHPHFYLALSRGKVRPGKDVVFGPATLVVEDVPILPITIPFGFFPFNSSYSSGFIMPSYGDESTRGFYLRDGGYYFAISDKMDLKLTGEIFTKGSWGLTAATNYANRYKYSGNFNFSYLTTITGEKNMPDYVKTKSLKMQWTHRQDAKANPNSSFSASVNYSSTSYDRSNLSSLYNPRLYAQSSKTSSISYSRTFPDIGLTLSSTFNLSQNMRDSSLAVTMPDLNISLTRFYPFKRKNAVGDEKWYEKIAVSYTGQLSNSINTKENQFFKKNLIRDWSNGMKHSIPVSATFTMFKYINVTPSFNYNERWYSFKQKLSWDKAKQKEVADTIYGFNRVYDYNFSVSANTKLYGFYKPWKKLFGDKVEMIRHVFTPTVSYSMSPDFGAKHYGYWDTYTYTDVDGNVITKEYSPYRGNIFGVPGKGKTGTLNFDVSNNVEMKIKSDKDSTGIKKISLIDELGANMSYNMAAVTKPWSDLSMRLRLKLTKSYTFNMNASFATYAYKFDKNGNVVVGDRTEWSYGRFGRFQGMSQNLSFTLNPEKLKKWFGGGDDKDEKNKDKKGKLESKDGEENETDPDNSQSKKEKPKEKKEATVDNEGYMAFKMPWSFTISYGIVMHENPSGKINVKSMRYPYKFTQTMNFSGNMKLSDGWNINYSSGYDFEEKKMSMTTVNITRDLHCFNMSCGLVLKPYTSYNFSIRANSSMLADALKYEKRSSAASSVIWY